MHDDPKADSTEPQSVDEAATDEEADVEGLMMFDLRIPMPPPRMPGGPITTGDTTINTDKAGKGGPDVPLKPPRPPA